MRKMEDKSLGVIWFDSNSNQYVFGTWKQFRTAAAENKGLEIIHEIKKLTAHLAAKIVTELNTARFESEQKHRKAA